MVLGPDLIVQFLIKLSEIYLHTFIVLKSYLESYLEKFTLA